MSVEELDRLVEDFIIAVKIDPHYVVDFAVAYQRLPASTASFTPTTMATASNTPEWPSRTVLAAQASVVKPLAPKHGDVKHRHGHDPYG